MTKLFQSFPMAGRWLPRCEKRPDFWPSWSRTPTGFRQLAQGWRDSESAYPGDPDEKSIHSFERSEANAVSVKRGHNDIEMDRATIKHGGRAHTSKGMYHAKNLNLVSIVGTDLSSTHLFMGYFLSMSKPETESWLNWSELALLIFGVILVVGLIGEHKGIKWRIWKNKEPIFSFLVIVGVAGELLADGGIFGFGRQLQAIVDEEVSKSNRIASQANEHSDELTRSNLLLQKQIAELQPETKSIETARLSIDLNIEGAIIDDRYRRSSVPKPEIQSARISIRIRTGRMTATRMSFDFTGEQLPYAYAEKYMKISGTLHPISPTWNTWDRSVGQFSPNLFGLQAGTIDDIEYVELKFFDHPVNASAYGTVTIAFNSLVRTFKVSQSLKTNSIIKIEMIGPQSPTSLPKGK